MLLFYICNKATICVTLLPSTTTNTCWSMDIGLLRWGWGMHSYAPEYCGSWRSLHVKRSSWVVQHLPSKCKTPWFWHCTTQNNDNNDSNNPNLCECKAYSEYCVQYTKKHLSVTFKCSKVSGGAMTSERWTLKASWRWKCNLLRYAYYGSSWIA